MVDNGRIYLVGGFKQPWLYTYQQVRPCPADRIERFVHRVVPWIVMDLAEVDAGGSSLMWSWWSVDPVHVRHLVLCP